MHKSEWTIIAILGVWKAGAAYVPIDPTFPKERIEFILEDTRAKVVITHQTYHALLRDLTRTIEILDIETLSFAGLSSNNPCANTSAENLAYIIYTSGTTGKPKGARVLHRGVVSFYLAASAQHFGTSTQPCEVMLLLANYVFDFSIEQITLSLLTGNKLLVPPTDITIDNSFYSFANSHKLTYLSGTPTQIQQFDLARLPFLTRVLVAGEPFQLHHYEQIRQQYQGTVINAYGTTETSVYNTTMRFESSDTYRNALGKPLANTQLYVLNSHMQMLPEGAIGELFIAGECVGDGYLNQAALTSARFLENPFKLLPNENLERMRFSPFYFFG
jgi:N-(5-amino-5-carboxypentanoyl)-L-cysteinyl-D-valine synthase